MYHRPPPLPLTPALAMARSAWLCLIHSEVHNPWDGMFRRLGLGTAADHHVHHRTFIYNYGHTMMWWDRLAGTYKSPERVKNFDLSGEGKVLSILCRV